MTKYYLFVFCCSVVFCNCRETKQNFTIPEIEADITSSAELNLSKYFENFRILKLSTDKPMGEIQRIRCENNNIYISDSKTLFIFSDDGELMSFFNKVGRGPGEYTSITDFAVNGENITILNRSLRKLFIYNHSGECISTHDVGCWAQAISPTIKHSYFLYCGNEYSDNEQHKLRRMQNGKEDSRYLPIDENQAKYLNISSLHNFYQHQDTIYFFETFSDIVYASIGDGLNPSFSINYKGRNIPSSFFKNKYANVAEFFMEFHKTSYAYGVLSFAVNDHFLMFNSYYLKNMKLTIFDRISRISSTYATIKDDIYFSGLTIPVAEFPFHVDKHIFVPLNGFDVVEWKKSYSPKEQFKEMLNNAKETDNPLLLMFDFRQ